MNRRDRRIFWWIVGIILTLFVLDCTGGNSGSVILEVIGCLAFGWVGFFQRVVPKTQVRWGMVASSVAMAIVLVIGAHLFLKWLFRESAGQRWRWRWTVSGAGLAFLMFSAGIGAVGVVHQTAWLATSPVPLVWDRQDLIESRINLIDIGRAILIYTHENGGHYPDDLPTLYLYLNGELTADRFTSRFSNDQSATGATTQEIADNLRKPNHRSYAYYGKGLSTPVSPDRIIASGPVENLNGEGMSILFGDGHVEWFNKEEAIKLLATTRPSQ